MQDKDGHDSRQLAVIARLYPQACFVTTDYKFYSRFYDRKEDIKRICGINILVMTPSEFMSSYLNG